MPAMLDLLCFAFCFAPLDVRVSRDTQSCAAAPPASCILLACRDRVLATSAEDLRQLADLLQVDRHAPTVGSWGELVVQPGPAGAMALALQQGVAVPQSRTTPLIWSLSPWHFAVQVAAEEGRVAAVTSRAAAAAAQAQQPGLFDRVETLL